MADDRERTERMDWLRANEVDREQYLLGKKIDRQVDPLLASEDREREALANGPGALFINRTTAGTTADVAVKVKEDPLFLIRKKEEEARQQLLSNPVKMKNLRELLAQEKSSKHKSKKKKKKQRARSRSPHRSGKAKRARDKDKRARDKDKRKYSPSPPSTPPPPKHQAPPSRTAPIRNKQYSSSSLSREELERRRQEMMADAESHGREREQRLRRLEEEHKQEEEERSTPHPHDFLQPLRVQSMSAAGSVQERIQRSIGSVQRTRASLDRHFLQK